MQLNDEENLANLYALNDCPYKPSSYWTKTPYKNNPLLIKPKADFRQDPLYENPKKQFKLDLLLV